VSYSAQLEALDREVSSLIGRKPHHVSAAGYGICLDVEADDSEVVKNICTGDIEANAIPKGHSKNQVV